MLRISRITNLLILIAFFSTCNTAFSQVRPNYQINLTETYHADAEIDEGDRFSEGNDEIRKRDFAASYQYFIYPNDKLTLMPGVSFDRAGFKYDFTDENLQRYSPDRLTSLRFNLIGSYSLVDKWSIISVTSAGFDSDFGDINTEDGNFNLVLGTDY